MTKKDELKMDYVVQMATQYTSNEEEAVLVALDDAGVIWERKYVRQKVKIGTYMRQIPIPMGSPDYKAGAHTLEETDVIRHDGYWQWVPLTMTADRVLAFSQTHVANASDETFKPCEEEEING